MIKNGIGQFEFDLFFIDKKIGNLFGYFLSYNNNIC
jgi:hypothetical protein